ncbi:MAG: hypothetical protein VCC99_14100 [Alphaproteobacteria bacterium]
MKKSLTLAAVITLALSGAAMAFHYPADMVNIDQILAGNPALSATQLADATKPEAEGDAPHNADRQEQSVDTLDDPLEILEGGGDKPRLTPIIEPGERIPCA